MGFCRSAHFLCVLKRILSTHFRNFGNKYHNPGLWMRELGLAMNITDCGGGWRMMDDPEITPSARWYNDLEAFA